MTILLVGGDLRQIYLANRFCKQATVLAYGVDRASTLSSAVQVLDTLKGQKETLKRVEVVLLPMPMMENETEINAPFAEGKISLEEVLQAIPLTAKIFAGQIKEPIKARFKEEGRCFTDLLAREELAVMNAVPTAEGTLQILLEELPTTIYGLSVLIVGAGRISRVLRRQLTALGAQVTVAARKPQDLAWAEMDGCQTMRAATLSSAWMGYDCIINTAPAMVLDESVLRRIPKETLLIDLASKPGGIDFTLAGQLGLHTIWALSLPGKTAPYRAGEIIYQTICNRMEEWGETLCR